MNTPYPSKIVLIGASTGGPGVIEKLISALPSGYPYPICIVQHFPAGLSASFASHLQEIASLNVIESSEGVVLEGGMVVIASGGKHLTFERLSDKSVAIRSVSPEEGYRSDFSPSVDDMFMSAARIWQGKSIMAILLSGIGDDGVEGIGQIAMQGGGTICQDKESSAVFGMPARAIERGSACEVLSPGNMIDALIRFGK